MTKRIAIAALLIAAWLLVPAPARAQNRPPVADAGTNQAIYSDPPSFGLKLEGSVFNAGGHPANGTVLTGGNFRMTLDALGESPASWLWPH